MNREIGRVLRNQLLRLVSQDFIDSVPFRSIVNADDPRWSPKQIVEVVRVLIGVESIDPDNLKKDAERRQDDARVLRGAVRILQRYQGEALAAVGKPLPLAQIRLIARNIAKSQEQVIPKEFLGKRGGVAATEGARRGAVIRRLDQLIPKGLSDRSAVIANLMNLPVGLTEDERKAWAEQHRRTSRQLVAATLKRGRT